MQKRQVCVKNIIGNGAAKEPIYLIHGHELKGGFLEGMGVLVGGEQRRKKWNYYHIDYDSKINKVYF